jgi:hypothetical protein
MRRLYLSCALLVGLALPASATDTTYELLSAPHVQETLTLQLNNDKKMLYIIDQARNSRDLRDNTAFVIDGQMDLVFRGFNPFQMSISTSEKTEADPNFGALAKFLDAAQKLGEGLAKSQNAANAAAQAGSLMPMSESLAIAGAMANLESAEMKLRNSNCDAYKEIHQALVKLQGNIGTTLVTRADFTSWSAESNRAAGIRTVRAGIQEKIKDIATHTEDLQKTLDAIHKISLQGAQVGESEHVCNEFRASTFALAVDVSHQITEVLDLRRELSSNLQDLRKYLVKFEDDSAWGRDGDYIFLRPTSDFDNVKLLTVSVRKRTVNGGDNQFEIKEEDPISTTIRLRQHSVMVPEVAAAMVATDLEFPKFGTAQKEGKTVVADAGKEKNAIKTALMLNTTFRLPYNSFIFPGIQIGLTQVDKYPGILVGPHIRFTRPRPLSISGGLLFTWYKGLDKLKIDDPISGTADLEKDLAYRRAPTATYFSIQYTF